MVKIFKSKDYLLLLINILNLSFFFSKEQKVKAVTKDQWNLLLEFSKQVNSGLSNYDSEGFY